MEFESASGGMVTIQLGDIIQAESRLHEARIANKGTAQELLSVYNQGVLAASRAIAHLKFEHSRAVRAADRRKAIVMLDIAPQVLSAKGLTTTRSPAGNEDLRNSVLNQDEEYLKLLDRADEIKTMVLIVEGKYDALNNAIIAVRRVLDSRDGMPALGGFIPADATAGTEVNASFGNARY